MNDYEAHQSSYDHTHKKRLKETKEMMRQAAPKKEEKGPLVQIKLGGTPKSAAVSGGGFKKGFAPAEGDVATVKQEENDVLEMRKKDDTVMDSKDADNDSDVTDEEDYYDPRRPTECTPTCPGRILT